MAREKQEQKRLSLDQIVSKYASNTGEFRSTGSLALDKVLSNGRGLPLKNTIEIFSPSGVGKSTIAGFVAKMFHEKYGVKTLYLDAEKGGMSQSLQESMGLKEEWLIHMFFDFYEECEEIMDAASAAPDDDIGLVVIDSITAIAPKKLMDVSLTDLVREAGLKARLDALLLMKLKSWVIKKNWSIILINQMRTHIDMDHPNQTRLKAAGGQAQEFSSDIRVELIPIGGKDGDILDDDDIKIGRKVRVQAIKCRWAKPYIQIPMYILYGKGVSNIRSVMDILVREGDIKQSSSYFKIEIPGFEKTVQGRVAATQHVQENYPAILKFIEEKGYAL